MSKHVLVVESDAHLRGLLARLLPPSGWEVTCVEEVEAGSRIADAGTVDVALVDEHPASGRALDAVRALRAAHPRLPIVLTGVLLPTRHLIEAIRLRVEDVLQKPFTPDELLKTLRRVLESGTVRRELALDFASSMAGARRAIGAGDLPRARLVLARARVGPFDGEAMSLAAVVAELAGEDHDADRGFRAAIALRDGEGGEAPSPYEGLARLATYGDAKPVARLSLERGRFAYHVLVDPRGELDVPAHSAPLEHVVSVTSLGLSSVGDAVYARAGRMRSFLVVAGTLDRAALAHVRSLYGDAPLLAKEATRAALDLDNLAFGDAPAEHAS